LADTDRVTIKITKLINQPPTADAGPDQTVDEGMEVTLDGTNSSDPDDGIDTYQWLQTAGPEVTLSDPTAPQPAFTSPDVGPDGASLIFKLIVSDIGGLARTDTCTVTVTWMNQPPTADAGPDQTVDEGETVILDAANSSDPDDGIDTYLWTQTEGPEVVLSDPAAPNPEFPSPDVGPDGASLEFELMVTDTGGLTHTDTCTINVSWMNLAPTADAGSDQTVDEGKTVTLDAANSFDPDDGIDSYLWTQISGPAVTLSDPAAPGPSFVSPDVNPDGVSLEFQLTVTDNGGLTHTDACTVHVTWVNQAPVADAGSDQTVDEGETVTLDAANSFDPDDGIDTYLWTQINGPEVILSDPASPNPEFTSPDVGPDGASLTFELMVTDDGGLSHTDTCTIEVTWINVAPTADAGPDQTVDEGITVTLDATGSYDPDDGIDTYLWTQTDGPAVTLSDTAVSQPFFTSPAVFPEGVSLAFELTVTDTGGLTHTDTCAIDVTWHYVPPPPFSRQTITLSNISPDIYLEKGRAAIYGSGARNHVILERGTNTELVNFPGSNTITLNAEFHRFAVTSSGVIVTFSGADGTMLKIPASMSVQTIEFNDISLDLVIENGRIILGGLPVPIVSGSVISGNAVAGLPVEGTVYIKDSHYPPRIAFTAIATDGSFHVYIDENWVPPFLLWTDGWVDNQEVRLLSSSDLDSGLSDTHVDLTPASTAIIEAALGKSAWEIVPETEPVPDSLNISQIETTADKQSLMMLTDTAYSASQVSMDSHLAPGQSAGCTSVEENNQTPADPCSHIRLFLETYFDLYSDPTFRPGRNTLEAAILPDLSQGFLHRGYDRDEFITLLSKDPTAGPFNEQFIGCKILRPMTFVHNGYKTFEDNHDKSLERVWVLIVSRIDDRRIRRLSSFVKDGEAWKWNGNRIPF